MTLDGASDHGVSEALYLRDPDGNASSSTAPSARGMAAPVMAASMVTERLDVDALLRVGA